MWNSTIKIFSNCNQTQIGVEGVVAIVFCLILAIVIGPLGVYKGIRDALRLNTARGWPIAKGVVVKSEAVRTSGNLSGSGQNSTIFTPRIRFKYSVENKEYESDKITWGGTWGSNSGNYCEVMLKAYPTGKKLDVYYDPKKPNDCIIQLRYSFVMAIPWIAGILFIVVGGGFAIGLTLGLIKQLTTKGLWP
jgi:hypothetical protein